MAQTSQPDAFHPENQSQSTKIKLETTIYKTHQKECQLIYDFTPDIQPNDYVLPLLIVSTDMSDNSVSLLRLFSDIHVGEFDGFHCPF